MPDRHPSTPYWETAVSSVQEGKVYIRGYDLEDLIGELPFTAAVFLLIRGRVPTPSEVRVLDAVLSAVLDYSLEKPGTAAARFAVSGNPSMVAGMATACLSVGRHTLATEDTSRFVVDLAAEFSRSELSRDEFAAATVRRLRAAKQRIPGLGHPMFKKIDPRGAALRAVAVEEGCWGEAAELYEAVHRAFTALPGKADIPINDVGVMAMVLVELGFTPEEGTGVALLSTLPGVIAHVSEELRTGRPIRVIPSATVGVVGELGKDFAADRDAAGWADGNGFWSPKETE
jgi:citryl-CoA lyase